MALGFTFFGLMSSGEGLYFWFRWICIEEFEVRAPLAESSICIFLLVYVLGFELECTTLPLS